VIHANDLAIQWQEEKSDEVKSNTVLSLEQVEKAYLANMLKEFDYQVDVLAQKLGVNVRTLYRKLGKHGISLENEYK
jgi:DNA-binding NtrC family response regulator